MIATTTYCSFKLFRKNTLIFRFIVRFIEKEKVNIIG